MFKTKCDSLNSILMMSRGSRASYAAAEKSEWRMALKIRLGARLLPKTSVISGSDLIKSDNRIMRSILILLIANDEGIIFWIVPSCQDPAPILNRLNFWKPDSNYYFTVKTGLPNSFSSTWMPSPGPEGTSSLPSFLRGASSARWTSL